ncbi:MAG: PhoH family protein, partial [Firmicutes bacterium]|nr:PhoH family protein [Bacillota bacterium]
MAEKAVSRTVLLEDSDEALQLFGKHDCYFNLVEDNFNVHLLPRGFELVIEGPEEEVEPLYQMFQE